MKNSPITSVTIDELHDNLLSAYKNIEARIELNYINSEVSYVSPVNFSESMETPRHRWFPYKEGFSPSFVENFLEKNLVKNKKGIVLDPFCGVGTTPIVSSKLGYSAIGMDVSALTIFIAQTKALQLSKIELQEFRNTIEIFSLDKCSDVYTSPDNETVKSYYDTEYLAAILRVRAFIETIVDVKIKALFFLSYLSQIEEYSTHRRTGNGVKRKTKLNYLLKEKGALTQIKNSIITSLNIFWEDLANDDYFSPPIFKNNSCIDKESFVDIDDIAIVITSPPYANCFDYSKIYMRELWLGDFFKSKSDQVLFRQLSIRSHVHASWDDRYPEYLNDIVDKLIKPILESQQLWSKKIPSMLSGYFSDLSRLLDLISSKASKGTRAGFVVSNSFYGGIPIATDLLIAMCGEELGYKVISVDVYRGMIPSSQQYKKIENKYFMRESLVVLEKL